MKIPLLAVCLCFATLTVVASAATSPGLKLYVSPTGDDQHDGRSAQQAFATVARARDAIRALKGALPAGGVEVSIQGGTYNLDGSLEFAKEDSGTAAAPIVYRAAGEKPARFLGGRVVNLSELSPVTDPKILARLDPAARGKVVAAPIAKLGLQHAGPFPPVFGDSGGIFELFWNGKRLPLSRWPNEGATTMKEAIVNGDPKTAPGVFAYRDDRAARWLQNGSVWLKGQWRVGWEEPAIRVAKIDPVTHTITFAVGIPGGIGNKYTRPKGNGKEPWFAINLLEEIDRPGEWAIDFDTGTLYLWPPAAEGELMVSQVVTPLIAARDLAHVSFVGLTLECSLGDGIMIENGDNVLVAGCTLRNLAKRGVAIAGGTRCGVQSCDLSELGEGCVFVSGGDRATLTPSGHFVVNNHLHNYGVLKSQYSAAVDVGSNGNAAAGNNTRYAVGIRVAHNLIHDAPRDAILYLGQDIVFEYNDISRCGFGSADVGAFYSWLDWTIRGIVIRYNFIHDTVGGVNPDDGASGNYVFGNIFAGPRTGVYIASGPDNTIENNIFIKDEGPIFGMDDRGAGRGYATNKRLLGGVAAVNPDVPPWSTRFPEMKGMLANRPELPWRTKVFRNLIVMKTGEPYVIKMSAPNKANPALFEWKDNLVTPEDPGFVNAAAGDFALKPGSPVFKEIPGFKPIPFDKIGLQLDEYRKTLPANPNAPAAVPKPGSQNTGESFGT